MAKRITPCCCNFDLERYSKDGRGFIGGEYRTDSPWHTLNFTNNPDGDGEFIEIDVNFCPFCGAQLVDEISDEFLSDQGEKNIEFRRHTEQIHYVYSEMLEDRDGESISVDDVVVEDSSSIDVYGIVRFGKYGYPADEGKTHYGYYIEWISDGANQWDEWWRSDILFWLPKVRKVSSLSAEPERWEAMLNGEEYM